MTKNKLVSVRIDEDLHKQSTQVLGEMGLTLSDATRIFLSFIAKNKAVPSQVFNSESYDEWFKAKVREAMEDSGPRTPHEEVVRRFRSLRTE